MTVGVRSVSPPKAAEIAAGRRALAAAAAARRPQRKAKSTRPFEPNVQRLRYTSVLMDIAQEAADVVQEILMPVLRTRMDSVDDEQVRRAIAHVRIVASRRITAKRAEQVAVKQASDLDLFASREVSRQVKALIGIDVVSAADSSRQLAKFVKDNVSLIRSIPDQMFDEVEEVVGKGFATGLRVESLSERIQERFRVAESRATLIARDQTSKLNSELTQVRQRAIGGKKYDWMTSRDERVREEHARLHGQTFSWDEPSAEGHPGEAISCRCQAALRVDDLLEALGL